MNRLSKNLTVGVAGTAAVTLSLLTPAGVLAAASRESAFCTNLPTTISKVTTNLTDRTDKLAAARSSRDQKMAANRAKWDQELATNRAKWDTQRQKNFTKLEAKATTDAEKAAVKTYQATVATAISARRTANDAARATYRAGVDSALASQRSTVDGQVATFKTAVATAEDAAQASCTATPNNGPAIRVTFVAALKSARQAFVADRKGDGTIGSQVKRLVQIRNASIRVNDAAFKQAMSDARTTLKAAFDKTAI